MRRLLSILLSGLMILSLCACGKGANEGVSDQTDETNNADSGGISTDAPRDKMYGDGNAGGECTDYTAANYFAFFDSTYDYSKEEELYFAYIVNTYDELSAAFADAFERWAERYNCRFVCIDCSNDTNQFVVQMETLAGQGVDGFLFDADVSTYPRVSDLANELVGDAWMSVMSYSYDEKGLMNHPFVGFDNTELGRMEAQYCIDYAKNNFAGFDISKAAMVNINYSIIVQFSERESGAYEVWCENFPDHADSFYKLDCVSEGSFTQEGAYNLMAPLLATHPEIEYWLVCGTSDSYSSGAARALEEYQKDDTSVVACAGGTQLVNDFDNDIESCWRGAIYSAQMIYAEPIFGAVYYMAKNWVTADKLWPDFVNENSNGYGWLLLESAVIEKDNYQEYLEWVDWHAWVNLSPYDEYDPDTGTQFEIVQFSE